MKDVGESNGGKRENYKVYIAYLVQNQAAKSKIGVVAKSLASKRSLLNRMRVLWERGESALGLGNVRRMCGRGNSGGP